MAELTDPPAAMEPTGAELHARLTAFEQRTLDLETVLVALVSKNLSAGTVHDAWRRIRDAA